MKTNPVLTSAPRASASFCTACERETIRRQSREGSKSRQQAGYKAGNNGHGNTREAG